MLEGQTWRQLQNEALLYNCKKCEYTPNDAETLSELQSRVHDFFRSLCQSLENELQERYSQHPDSNENSSLTRSDRYLRKRSSDSTGSDDSCFLELEAQVLVVTHGGVIRELLRHFVDDLGCVMSWVNPRSPNCALSRFAITTDVISTSKKVLHIMCLELFNVDHLQQRQLQPLVEFPDFLLSIIIVHLILI